MIENTLNNHLIYYYNDDVAQRWRLDDDDTTHMRVGGCERKPFSAKIEWNRIARLLADQYPDITVFMSGGLDSEIALRCFIAAGVRPRLATVRFHDGKNDYDIGPMIEMVKSEFDLECHVIDFDPEEFFLSGEYLEVAERYQAYTFYQQILLRVAEQYSAPMITVDEIELEKRPVVDYDTGQPIWNWSFIKKEDQDAVWRRFADKTGIPALNNFYTYTPESMLAFLRLPTTAALIRDQIPYKHSWTSSKMKIYGDAGFRFRPRPKWHGMENYMHLWDFAETHSPKRIDNFEPRTYSIPALDLEDNLEKGTTSLCHIV